MKYLVPTFIFFTSGLFFVNISQAKENLEIFKQRAGVELADIIVLKNTVERSLNTSESIKVAIPTNYQAIASIVMKNGRVRRLKGILERKASEGRDVSECYVALKKRLNLFIEKAEQYFKTLVTQELDNMEIELERSYEILSRVENALKNNLLSEFRHCINGGACMITGGHHDDISGQIRVINSLRIRILLLVHDVFQDFEKVAVSPTIREEVLDYGSECLHR